MKDKDLYKDIFSHLPKNNAPVNMNFKVLAAVQKQQTVVKGIPPLLSKKALITIFTLFTIVVILFLEFGTWEATNLFYSNKLDTLLHSIANNFKGFDVVYVTAMFSIVSVIMLNCLLMRRVNKQF